nr:MAG TPA: hypothetical protein [Caudoviricetes sp.]
MQINLLHLFRVKSFRPYLIVYSATVIIYCEFYN